MRPLVFLILLFISLSFSGCISIQRESLQETQDLEPSAILRFSDVPYPTSFKIMSDKSFILESGGVRAGVLRYIGRAEVEDVVLFYKIQMPIHNWALLNILEYKERMLNFERENESCVITIKPKGNRWVEISVSLAPKSPMPVSEKEIKIEEHSEPKANKK